MLPVVNDLCCCINGRRSQLRTNWQFYQLLMLHLLSTVVLFSVALWSLFVELLVTDGFFDVTFSAIYNFQLIHIGMKI